MAPEDTTWLISLVRDRYQYLNLNMEEAEKIYLYEKIKDNYSDKHYFSDWEEMDFEVTTFKES